MIHSSKIFITGGAGFIGSSLANVLLKYNNKVIVVDDLSMGRFENLIPSTNLITIKGSVTDKELMTKILKEYKFDYIFHLAAVASVAASIAKPLETHEVNFDSTLILLEYLVKHPKNLKRLVFSSSAAVYGNEKRLPKREGSPILPLTPYAIDKFSSERWITIYNTLYGIPTSCTRFFNVYGPKQNPNSPYSGFISILVDRLKNLTELNIFGDGEQARDFVYIEDVIQALILIATSEESLGEVYNVGTGSQSTLNELIELSQVLTQKNIKVNYLENREGDIRHSVSDISKLKAIGYRPKFDINQGMKKYFDYEFK